MRRTIQREVDNKLSRMLLDGLIQPGQRLTVGVADGQLTFDVGDGDRTGVSAETPITVS